MSNVTVRHDSSFGCTTIVVVLPDGSEQRFEWNDISPTDLVCLFQRLGHEVTNLDVRDPRNDIQEPIYA